MHVAHFLEWVGTAVLITIVFFLFLWFVLRLDKTRGDKSRDTAGGTNRQTRRQEQAMRRRGRR